MFKVGDIIIVKDRNIGVIESVDECYVNIYWSDDRNFGLFDYDHLKELLCEAGSLWSHHAN
jgi:hypothetical protein